MINKEDYRNMDSIMNWGKYAESLEQEVSRLEKYCYILEECIQTDNIGMEQERKTYQNRIAKLEKALKECCRQSSCRYITIEDEYCEHEDVVDTCEDCLFNHYMKGVEKNG